MSEFTLATPAVVRERKLRIRSLAATTALGFGVLSGVAALTPTAALADCTTTPIAVCDGATGGDSSTLYENFSSVSYTNKQVNIGKAGI